MHLVILFWWCITLLLTASITYLSARVTYNLKFHAYAKYPGPLWAKISPLYALLHAYRGDLHLDVVRCHEKYGSVVRYSPNRLVFNTAEATRDIYGQGRNTQKSSGYAPHPYFPTVFNTHNCIDKEMHARKRRIVSQGFSASAITYSEPMIIQHVDNFCNALLKAADESDTDGGWSTPQDMAAWTNYLTLDVISSLTYGRAFNLLTSPSLRWLVNAIISGNRRIYMRFAFPALFNVSPSAWYNPDKWLFPDMADERQKFLETSTQYAKARMEDEEKGHTQRNDILSALLKARDPKTGTKLSEAEVWGEAHLMIAAGGDTTSTALASTLFYLSRHSGPYTRLATEIRNTFPSLSSIHQGPALNSCNYLRACLEEAMRLAPPAPGALWREVCAGGAVVDGEHIPAGQEVGVCQYAICHNAALFSEPYAFRPERFLQEEGPHGIKTAEESMVGGGGDDYFTVKPTRLSSLRSEARLSPSPSSPASPIFFAQVPTPGVPTPLPRTPKGSEVLPTFAPFLIGPRSCVAKPFAYLEMSLAIAKLMWCLDFSCSEHTGEGVPGSGIMGRERKEEFQIVDMFSSSKSGPVLRFRRRRETTV